MVYKIKLFSFVVKKFKYSVGKFFFNEIKTDY